MLVSRSKELLLMPPGSQHSVNFRKTTAEKVKIQHEKKRTVTLLSAV